MSKTESFLISSPALSAGSKQSSVTVVGCAAHGYLVLDTREQFPTHTVLTSPLVDAVDGAQVFNPEVCLIAVPVVFVLVAVNLSKTYEALCADRSSTAAVCCLSWRERTLALASYSEDFLGADAAA